MSRSTLIGALSVLLGAPCALAQVPHTFGTVGRTVLLGDNQSGLEFSSSAANARYGYAFIAPNPSYAISALGANIVRVPFLIQRLQPSPLQPFNAVYEGYLLGVVAEALQRHAYVVLDPHNFGEIFNQDITGALGERYYLDFIARMGAMLAAAKVGLDQVGLGLMNEPNEHTDAVYRPVFQSAIDAVRNNGFTGYIFYPAASWSDTTDVAAGSTFMQGVTDPAGNLVAEFHVYWDSNDSGTENTPITNADLGHERLDGAISWATANHRMFLLGETAEPEPTPQFSGAAPSAAYVQSDGYFRSFMSLLLTHPQQVFGITLWGDGPWWGANYLFDLAPKGGQNTFDAATLAALIRAN